MHFHFSLCYLLKMLWWCPKLSKHQMWHIFPLWPYLTFFYHLTVSAIDSLKLIFFFIFQDRIPFWFFLFFSLLPLFRCSSSSPTTPSSGFFLLLFPGFIPFLDDLVQIYGFNILYSWVTSRYYSQPRFIILKCRQGCSNISKTEFINETKKKSSKQTRKKNYMQKYKDH